MNLQNIPILKDLDFADPVKRKNYILIAAAGILFLVLLVCILLKQGKEEEPVAEAAQEESYEAPDIPLGEDRDNLSGKTVREVMTSGKRENTADLLFEDSNTKDPFDDLLKKIDEKPDETARTVVEPIVVGSHDVYPETQKKEETHEGVRQDSGNGIRPGSSYDAERERLEREARVRRRMIENGLDPETGLPLAATAQNGYPSEITRQGQTATAQSPSQQGTAQETPAEEPAAPKVQVRRSGGVSSLGSGISSANSGVSSLGEQSQYVTEDPTHPFAVKFAYNEKLTSGQRVTLRLCEDMVVNGILIPVNTHLFATCSIGERLDLKISSININGKIYTLNYVAYDNDGGRGLYCPTSAAERAREQAKSEAEQMASTAIQSVVSGYTSRIVSTGVSMLSSKSGNMKVEVTAGYQFFILAE